MEKDLTADEKISLLKEEERQLMRDISHLDNEIRGLLFNKLQPLMKKREDLARRAGNNRRYRNLLLKRKIE